MLLIKKKTRANFLYEMLVEYRRFRHDAHYWNKDFYKHGMLEILSMHVRLLTKVPVPEGNYFPLYQGCGTDLNV